MFKFKKKPTAKPVYSLIGFLDKIGFSQVFTFWIIIIFFFGIVYFLLAYVPGNSLRYSGEVITTNAGGFLNSLYFSFITATSLGYGDVAPLGVSKFLSGFEVIIGLIIYGVLISKLVGVKQEVLLEEVYNISYEEIIDRLRSGLYLFRSDINRMLEKIETDTIKEREIKDLWILFSSLDTTLTNIKQLIIPAKSEKYYHKRIDVFRLELFLNSVHLSMKKILELLRTLKTHELEWRNDLLVTSIEDDIKVVREIIEYQSKKSNEKKVSDKLKELKNTINEIERELKAEEKKEEPNQEKAEGKKQEPKEEEKKRKRTKKKK